MQFHYNIKVMNVEFDLKPGCKQATRIELQRDGQQEFVDLTENDLVFITPGGCVENSTMGSQNTPAHMIPRSAPAAGWDMWRRIAAQDPAFGNPDKFLF